MSTPKPLQRETPVACPRCSRVALVRINVKLVDNVGRTFFEYVCDECGHYQTT